MASYKGLDASIGRPNRKVSISEDFFVTFESGVILTKMVLPWVGLEDIFPTVVETESFIAFGVRNRNSPNSVDDGGGQQHCGAVLV